MIEARWTGRIVRTQGGAGEVRRSRRNAESGASVVEAAIVTPLILLLIFGMIDFGWTFSNIIQLRQGLRDGARSVVVDRYGNESCSLTGYGGGNAETAKVLCKVHHEIGADDGDIRVNISFPDGGKTAPPDDNSLRVCAELQLDSISGLFGPLLDNLVSKTEVTMRIEQDLSAVDAGSETSFDSWSWCS